MTRELYWLIKRRRTPTLIRWWRELNSWGWPKEIPDPEGRDVIGAPRRSETMTAIAEEIGRRVILGRIPVQRKVGAK